MCAIVAKCVKKDPESYSQQSEGVSLHFVITFPNDFDVHQQIWSWFLRQSTMISNPFHHLFRTGLKDCEHQFLWQKQFSMCAKNVAEFRENQWSHLMKTEFFKWKCNGGPTLWVENPHGILKHQSRKIHKLSCHSFKKSAFCTTMQTRKFCDQKKLPFISRTHSVRRSSHPPVDPSQPQPPRVSFHPCIRSHIAVHHLEN